MQRPWDRSIQTLLENGQRMFQAWSVQAVAVTVLVIAALIGLAMNKSPATNSQQSDLFAGRNLAPAEIERIEAALGSALLTDYTIDAGRIFVPAQMRGQYLSAIREAKAIPQSFHSPTEEAISSASIIETSRQRSQRLDHALEKEASLAIAALPGVLEAFVHFDSATDQSYRRKTEATAVVGVKTAEDSPLDERSFRAIQAMLLGFKAGLTAKNITIADLTSKNHFRGAMEDQSPEAILAMRKADLERTWMHKLRSAVAFAPQAKIAAQLVASEDGQFAKSVRCSVSIPRTLVPGESNTAKARSEVALRRKVQAALLPLLPQTDTNVDTSIAVTVYDRTSPSATGGAWMARSTNLFTACLFGVATIGVVFLIWSPSRRREVAAESTRPDLKIYDAERYAGDAMEVSTGEELQNIASEDPDAVAESLSDFIDRAS